MNYALGLLNPKMVTIQLLGAEMPHSDGSFEFPGWSLLFKREMMSIGNMHSDCIFRSIGVYYPLFVKEIAHNSRARDDDNSRIKDFQRVDRPITLCPFFESDESIKLS